MRATFGIWDTPVTHLQSFLNPFSILNPTIQVESYIITDSFDGAKFQRQDGWSWEPHPVTVMRPIVHDRHLGRDMDRFDAINFDLGFFVSKICANHGLLFIMHLNGLISVWNISREKQLVHWPCHVMENYRTDIGHNIFDTMGDNQPMKWAFDDECQMILGRNTSADIFNADVPDIAVWKYDLDQDGDFSIAMISQLEIEAYVNTFALDIDANLAVVGYCREDQDQESYYEVRLWDLNQNQNQNSQIIDREAVFVRCLKLDSKAEMILVARRYGPLLEVS